MLARIGTNTLTPGEIKEHAYHGTNASYNLNALFNRGYLTREEVVHDRRQKLISLTPKGLKAAAAVRNALSEARIREVA